MQEPEACILSHSNFVHISRTCSQGSGTSVKQLQRTAVARLNEFSDRLRAMPSVNLSAQVRNLSFLCKVISCRVGVLTGWALSLPLPVSFKSPSLQNLKKRNARQAASFSFVVASFSVQDFIATHR